jgi:hypothetical protein
MTKIRKHKLVRLSDAKRRTLGPFGSFEEVGAIGRLTPG